MIKLLLPFSFLLFLFSESCNKEAIPFSIQTVNAKIDASQMGSSLIHEHILVDFIGADSTGYERWDREEVVKVVLPYLRSIREQGVQSLVDCTPAYLGRDPRLLKMLSDQSGLNIITNTGYYGARQNKFLPQHAFHESADQLAQRWIAEWENGIENTGIKPGFIKIGVDRESLSPIHQKLVQAAAKTHLATGLTIASHTGPSLPAFEELALLKNEGVAADAFIWVHAQNEKDLAQHVKAAKMGAWISLDNLSDKQVNKYVELVKNMKAHHVLHRVLLSHDAGWYRPGEAGGGKFRHFNTLHQRFLPALKKEGFSKMEIEQLIIKNPAEAMAIRVRAL